MALDMIEVLTHLQGKPNGKPTISQGLPGVKMGEGSVGTYPSESEAWFRKGNASRIQQPWAPNISPTRTKIKLLEWP